MAKKKEEKIEKIEREYVIPLREKCRVVPRYRKTEKAIKVIKEFIARHMKIYDRDLSKVKLDSYLNEMVWGRGIKNPPHKIKVKAVKEGEIVKVYASELPKKLKFKKAREEKIDKKSSEIGKKKKEEKKVVEEKKTEEEIKEEGVKKEVEEEKKSAVVEAGREIEKAAAKQIKQLKVPKQREQKHQRRVALQK